VTSFLEVLAAIVLLVGIGVFVICCLALLVVRDPYARLHCASLASIAGPLATALGAMLSMPGGNTVFRALLFALVALASTAVTTHALGRALRIRQEVEISGP
jgi:monovalent cation/proton antiporter MnhG/PhaG subunit